MTSSLLSPISEWAALAFASLADAGVTDVVASPGSRSTPFVVAASRAERLRLSVVVDERSAAFFALGQARLTGRPTALLCTSGTAGAHWLPAVVEASAAHVPLVLITADRPPELQDCCAAQTTDQRALFVGYTRLFLDAGLPESVRTLRSLRRMTAQAVHASLLPTPGPVHLNLPARKPLEPVAARGDDELAFATAARALRSRPIPRVAALPAEPDPEAIAAIADSLATATRGLIVAGPGGVAQQGAREAVAALARATGFAVLADACSQLRVAGTGALAASDLLLSSPALRAAEPEVILQIGAAPTTSAWDALVTLESVKTHVVIAPHGWHDPASTATHLLACDPSAACLALARSCAVQQPLLHRNIWTEKLALANRQALEVLDERGSDEALTEPAVARAAVYALEQGGVLVLGNSLPIRTVEAWGGLLPPRVPVLNQRGVNGIDGLISGAAGAASMGEPTLLLVGDVSAVHDLGGLAVARDVAAPLVLLVVDNGGGRIFEQLPVARAGLSAEELRHFTTPHHTDFETAARTFGIRYERTALHTLRLILREALARPGPTLVHAMVPPHDATDQRARLQRRVDELVAKALVPEVA